MRLYGEQMVMAYSTESYQTYVWTMHKLTLNQYLKYPEDKKWEPYVYYTYIEYALITNPPKTHKFPKSLLDNADMFGVYSHDTF